MNVVCRRRGVLLGLIGLLVLAVQFNVFAAVCFDHAFNPFRHHPGASHAHHEGAHGADAPHDGHAEAQQNQGAEDDEPLHACHLEANAGGLGGSGAAVLACDACLTSAEAEAPALPAAELDSTQSSLRLPQLFFPPPIGPPRSA